MPSGAAAIFAPEHPRNLAVLRIVVAGIVLLSPETWTAEHAASLPASLRAPPEGLAWAARTVPITPGVARLAAVVLVLSAACGVVGLASRTSMALVALSGLYVFGVAQLGGSVLHDMHLLWFAALLAASPCGDALSVDRLLARRRGAPEPARSRAVTIPLLGVRALLGLVYFFPGFWKLAESGAGWMLSDNLRNHMYWKWYQHGALPALRVDRWDALVQAGAVFVVLFELAFPVLAIVPRTRLVAAVGGVLFHVATDLFLFIPFPSLWVCYVALVDWGPAGAPVRDEPPRRLVPSGVLAAALVTAVAIQGARNSIQAFPLACYPTFQWRAPDAIPDVAIEAVLPDGSTRIVPDGPGTGGSRSQAEWPLVWRIAGQYGDAVSEERLRDYWRRVREKPVTARAAQEAAALGARTLRFHRAWYSVVPEHAGRPPLRAEVLGEIEP